LLLLLLLLLSLLLLLPLPLHFLFVIPAGDLLLPLQLSLRFYPHTPKRSGAPSMSWFHRDMGGNVRPSPASSCCCLCLSCLSSRRGSTSVFAVVAVAFAVASKVQRGFSPASKSRREAATALPKAGAKAPTEATNLLPLPLLLLAKERTQNKPRQTAKSTRP
jgi:hypothetical protein